MGARFDTLDIGYSNVSFDTAANERLVYWPTMGDPSADVIVSQIGSDYIRYKLCIDLTKQETAPFWDSVFEVDQWLYI